MPDLNDVVRHVILRILVDQTGLGAEMAAARAKLKELENEERKSNAARAKDAEKVTDAVSRQSKALEDNRKAHEAATRAAQGSADKTAEQHRAATASIKDETKAIEQQTIAEAKAERERSKTRNERLEADAKRKKINQDTVNGQARDEAKLAELTSKADGDRLARDAARRRYNQDSKNLQEHATIALGNLERREQDQTQALAVKNTQERLRGAAALRRFNAESRATDAAAAEKQSNTERTNAQKLTQDLLDLRAARRRLNEESAAGVARKDYTTEAGALRSDRVADRGQNRQDANAANKRRLDSQKQIADLEAKKLASDQKVKAAQEKHENDQHGKVMSNLAKELEAAERLVELRSRNADARTRRDATRPDSVRTTLARNSSARAVAGSNENAAGSREVGAAARAADAIDAQSENAVSRRAKSLRDEETGRARINEIAARTTVIDQRGADIAERRARAIERDAERSARAAARPSTVRGAVGNLGDTVQRLLRASSDANPDTRPSRTRQVAEALDSFRSDGPRRAISAFFGAFSKGEEGATGVLTRVRARLRGVSDEIKRIPASGGGGGIGGFIRVFGSDFERIGNAITAKTGGMSRALFSFRGVILLVVSAFGPLAATAGAAGAALLGLASNIAALSGAALALPGLIGALVGGIGALALVAKPISGVFDAFTASQKASAAAAGKNATAQRDAARALVDAKRAAQDAQTEQQRAQEDAPRSYARLHDARVQAARDIQDYRLALQKLKFDQEGAELGVDSAEQNYRRALADPTKNNLDRQIARHDVQGALFDQRDQTVSQGRLIEDANTAERKGVEGTDAVIDAKRGIEDANRRLEDATRNLTRATEDQNQAQKDADAGGKATRQAQDALNAAIAKLPPGTRTVVKAVLALNDAYKAMRDRLSERIFGPLAGDTGKFAGVLQTLESFLTPAADALGYLAHQAITLLSNPDWKAFFAKQGVESGYIIRQLGDAALSAADGFRAVVEQARPFTRYVVDGVKALAGSFQAFATSDAGREKISTFLSTTRRRIHELLPVLGNFAKGLAGFFTALNTPGADGGADFTTKINQGLLGISATFRKLGEQAADPKSGFRKWLTDVGPLIKDTVTFIGAAGKAIGDLFKDKDNINEARKILANLSEKILPALVDFFGRLASSGVISKVLGAIGSVLDAFNAFLDAGGATSLSVFADILVGIGKTIDFLVTKVPGLTSVLAALSVVIAGIAGAALFARLTGLVKIFTGLGTLARLFTKGGFTATLDLAKDKVLGRDTSESAARRDATKNGAGLDPARPGGVLPTLYRMETLLQSILATLRGGGGSATSNGGGGNGPTGGDDDDRRDRRPNGPQTGGGGSTGGGGPGGESTRPRRTVRPKRRYSLPIFDTRDETQDIIDAVRNPRTTSNRRTRSLSPTDINPISIPGTVLADGSTPVTRGNSMYRSERVQRDRQRTAERQQRIDDEDDAYVEDRRRTADERRNNRPSAGTPSSARRRRTLAQQRYTTRNQRLTEAPLSLPDRPVLADVSDVDNPRRLRTTLPSGALPSGTVSSGAVSQASDGSLRRFGRRLATTVDSDAGEALSIPAAGTDGPLRRFGRRFATTMDSDAGGGVNTPVRGSDGLLRRLGRRARDVMDSEQGSVQLGPSRADEDSARRGRSTRPGSRRGARRFGRGRGLRGIASAGAGEYEEGFEDGLSAAGGGGLSPLDALDGPDRDREGRTLRRRGQAVPEDESERALRGLPGEREGLARGGRGSGGRLRNLLGGAESAAERSAGGGRAGGLLSRLAGRAGGLGRLGGLGGGLARGLAGGLGGLAAGLALQFGGDAAINKFVKNDGDANSLSRGLGAVSTGAGIGATIGSIIPGVGTVVGGALGGLAGGAYSLVKDKNLRSFVGGKISGGAQAVGGFFSRAGSAVSNFFGGGDGEGKAGPGVGGIASAALGPVGALLARTDIGKSIIDSLNRAGSKIGDFFTKTIPGFFNRGVAGIVDFFTRTLPSLPGRAFDAITFGAGKLLGFFTKTLPRVVTSFFVEDVPFAAGRAFALAKKRLLDPLVAFIKAIPGFFTQTIPKWFESVAEWRTKHIVKPLLHFIVDTVPNFFTQTIPRWFEAVDEWRDKQIVRPLRKFILHTVPDFFTETIPKWFKAAPQFFHDNVTVPVTDFFAVKIPQFFTKTLPEAIKALPGFLYSALVQPVLDFFTGLKDHVSDVLKGDVKWVKALFSRGSKNFQAGEDSVTRMSGGVIEGVYQGIEDSTRLRATPGEFVVRRSKVQQPRGAEFLRDYNEGRFDPARWYSGLNAVSSPAVMSLVPPSAPVLSSTSLSTSTTSNTQNNGLSMGDITINNPVVEKSEHSLRRQIQLAAIRHRR